MIKSTLLSLARLALVRSPSTLPPCGRVNKTSVPMAPNRPSSREAISQQISECEYSLPANFSSKSLGSNKIEQVSTVLVFPKFATVESSRKCSWLPPAMVRASHWNARKNAGPQIPSTSKPTLRWNSRTAESVLFAKMPSTRSNANPSSIRRCCNCATSSPCIT